VLEDFDNLKRDPRMNVIKRKRTGRKPLTDEGLPEDCGYSDVIHSRIVGGQIAPIGENIQNNTDI